MRERLRAALPALIAFILFLVALEVMRRELQTTTWHTLTGDVFDTPPWRLLTAICLTVLNYAVLTGYDFIALAYVGRQLPRLRVALTSFLAYAVANNVGFAMLSGASVRYRFYTRWGVTAEELSRIVFSYTVTFWLGLLALGGLSLAIGSLPAAHELPVSDLAVPIGWLLAGLAAGYVILTHFRNRPLRIGRFALPLPKSGLAMSQLVVSAIDWFLAGAVVYVLLPTKGLSFWTVLSAFLAAQLLGLVSHVPGGIGVFEGLMILLLKPYLTSGQVLPALVVYRAVYYLLPLAIALVTLIVDEVRLHREHAGRIRAYFGRLTEQLTPRLLAVFTFIGGIVLLFSGATPAAEGRLEFVGRILPFSLIETSHFIGSLAGAALLLLSQGLSRRLDAAYHLSVLVIISGIVASLFKGADYEEATLLGLLLIALWRSRPAFNRKSALLATRFTTSWLAAVIAAMVASVWIGFFAFKHVEYSQELWWQFELDAEASRFLRGSVGAAALILMAAAARLIRHAPHEIEAPSDVDLNNAASAIAAQKSTYPFLAYLGDKGLLFDVQKKGFVMYGVQGRTWVAMGDPVSQSGQMAGLVRLFLERCNDFGGTPVFYQVRKDLLHLYADFGLTFVKLGEEARVALDGFTLEGGQAYKARQAFRRLEKEGATFRVIQAENTMEIMDQLEAVSDNWLEQKSGGEKGFSLGFFEASYLRRFPVAVIERAGRILAFANLWPGPDKEELSVDLMRYHKDAPKGIMETLLVHLMQWGKTNGYRWFALGMAPMSGFERSPIASLWTRLGIFLYEHGEGLYNFQGLRAYKDKFNPVWEPRYLAYPGGLKLPRILADVSALIAGGYRRIFLK